MILYGGGALVIIGLGFLAYYYAFELRRMGVSDPVVLVVLGTTYPVEASLMFKPRWKAAGDETAWIRVPGVAYFKTDPNQNIFQVLASAHHLGLRGYYRADANLSGHVDIRGLKVGRNKFEVYGWADTTHYHSGDEIPVIVIAPQQSFTSLYNAAVTEAKTVWSSGALGNMLGGDKCNAWADWIYKFAMHYKDSSICKIEKVYFEATNGMNAHICVRITLCEGGEYYLDPHKFPDEPMMEKSEYERRYRAPSYVPDSWTR